MKRSRSDMLRETQAKIVWKGGGSAGFLDGEDSDVSTYLGGRSSWGMFLESLFGPRNIVDNSVGWSDCSRWW